MNVGFARVLKNSCLSAIDPKSDIKTDGNSTEGL
jgi:hypothetical protein